MADNSKKCRLADESAIAPRRSMSPSLILLRLVVIVGVIGITWICIATIAEIVGYPLLRSGGWKSILIFAATLMLLGLASRLLVWGKEPSARKDAIALVVLLSVSSGFIAWILIAEPKSEVSRELAVGMVFLLVTAVSLWRLVWPGSSLSLARQRATRIYAIGCLLIVWGVWLFGLS